MIGLSLLMLVAQGACPSGQTEVRPGRCEAPRLDPPSIVDYRPRSMLVVPEHPVPRARFPVVDFHGHPRRLVDSDSGLAELAAVMEALNLGAMVVAENRSGDDLREAITRVAASPLAGRVLFLAGVDFRGVGEPGWAERAVAQLEADVAAGAVGIGEISKALGQYHRRADGSRLAIDDLLLDPVWEAAARLDLPVFMHTADPPAFWQPLDYTNERWLELSLFPNRRPDSVPSFEQLMTERDNVLRRHPNTTFVLAHLSWYAHDLGRLGRLLDEFPNAYAEVGAVLYDLGRQPRAARDFFVRYQDRLLFGKDAFQPEEYPYYWRVFETADDYFDYYRPYHAFWKLYGLDLPEDVLRRVYYANAFRILPPAARPAAW